MECLPGPILLAENIWYLPRGTRWIWQGKQFLAIGGGCSAYPEQRRAMGQYCENEAISERDHNACVASGPADVVLAHECPWGINIRDLRQIRGQANQEIDRLAGANRNMLQSILHSVNPQVVFHGHYGLQHQTHMLLSGRLVDVIGLAGNGSRCVVSLSGPTPAVSWADNGTVWNDQK